MNRNFQLSYDMLPVLLSSLLLISFLFDGIVECAEGLAHRQQAETITCMTPNNEYGTCVNIRSCATLYNLIVTNGREASTATYIKKSRCITPYASTLVCCPQNQNYGSGITAGTKTTAAPTTPRIISGENSNSWSQCGKSEKKDLRIVGGRNASIGEWPWMAALGYRSATRPGVDYKCGATLIANKWVITAAHCVTNLGSFFLSVVRLGDLDLDSNVEDGSPSIDVEVQETIIHENYSTSPILNDIALLRLKNNVQFSQYIRPICLLSGNEFRSNTFYNRKRPFIIGWGALEWRGASSTRLQEAVIPIVDPELCSQAYSEQITARIDETVLCAGGAGKDTCQGDSGGPLIFPGTDPNNLTFYLGGIVSYGIRCADPNFPGVYTRVAAFTDWIARNTGLNVYIRKIKNTKEENFVIKNFLLNDFTILRMIFVSITLKSVEGQYLPVAPGAVWDINSIPAGYGYSRGGGGGGAQQVGTLGAIGGQNYDTNGFRDQNGYYLGGTGLRNGWDLGRTYGGGRDYGITGVQGNAYGDVNGRNKGHQVAGFSTSYQKNESGNKATYYDDGLGHGGVVQYGLKDQRYKDGAGNAYGGGVHDTSLKSDAVGNQGQYGNAGGFRNSDNRGGTINNADIYHGGLVQGGGASGGVIGAIAPIGPIAPIAPVASLPSLAPIAPAPMYIQQPIALSPRPVPIASGISPAFAPGPPYISLRPSSSPYVIPTPTKLYVDKPAVG